MEVKIRQCFEMFWCVLLLLSVAQAETSANNDFSVEENGISIGRIFLGVCDLVSAITLLFILILYLCGPDISRLHGKCIAAFCLTLSLYFVCGALELVLLDLSIKYCSESTYAGTFLCVASFCWISVVSFDIWLSYKRSMVGRPNPCNFMWYFLFSFTAPSLMLAAALCLAYGSVDPTEVDMTVCIYDVRGLLGFLLLWLVSVVCSGVLLFCTSKRVKQEHNASHERGHMEPTSDRNRYVCYVNLFTVMAGNWIIYVLLNFASISLRRWFPEHSAWSSVINYYARVLISLQGVAVFVACVWKTQYRAKLPCCGRSSYNVPQVAANNGSL